MIYLVDVILVLALLALGGLILALFVQLYLSFKDDSIFIGDRFSNHLDMIAMDIDIKVAKEKQLREEEIIEALQKIAQGADGVNKEFISDVLERLKRLEALNNSIKKGK
jgi:hypothetical protein